MHDTAICPVLVPERKFHNGVSYVYICNVVAATVEARPDVIICLMAPIWVAWPPEVDIEDNLKEQY